MALGELRYIRASWESIITTASAIATVWKITSQFTVVRKRRTKRLFDELSNDERLEDPELAFKTLPTGTALFQLQSRFEGLHSGSFSFRYPKSLLQLSDADLNSAAQKFQETYSADIDSDFVAELRSFRREFRGEIETSQTVLDLQFQNHIISPRTGYCLCIVCYNPGHSGQCRAFLL